jgi:hypothetical protein
VYVEPEYDKTAFTCPMCDAFANFHWYAPSKLVEGRWLPIGIKAAMCTHCKNLTLWLPTTKQLVYPHRLTGPLPHPDLPDSCQSEYEEARRVQPESPRAAAALLRLCIQKLCMEFGEPGRNLNDDIGALVRKGLDRRLQQALDVVRVTGNNAVHPGTMDICDDVELVNKLFKLVNLIVEEMITKPKELEDLYRGLPESARKAIDERDG